MQDTSLQSWSMMQYLVQKAPNTSMGESAQCVWNFSFTDPQ